MTFVETHADGYIPLTDIAAVSFASNDGDYVSAKLNDGRSVWIEKECWRAATRPPIIVPCEPGVRIVLAQDHQERIAVAEVVVAWSVDPAYPNAVGVTTAGTYDYLEHHAYLFPDGHVDAFQGGRYPTLEAFKQSHQKRHEKWVAEAPARAAKLKAELAHMNPQ